MGRVFNGSTHLAKATGAQVVVNTRTAVCWCCWMKGAGQQDKGVMMEGRNNATGSARIGTENVSGGTKARLLISSDAGVSVLDATSAGVICNSNWHHVLFGWDASGNWKFYLDGALDASGSLASHTITPTWAALGCNARNSNAQFFAGTIAHAANWTRLLSLTEVKSLASGLSPVLFAPVHYWPVYGIDSPEPDIGQGTHVAHTLTGPPTIATDNGVGLSPFAVALMGRAK